VIVHVVIFWVVTPSSLVGGYRHRNMLPSSVLKCIFFVTCLHNRANSWSYTNQPRRWRQYIFLKFRYPTTRLHGITTCTLTNVANYVDFFTFEGPASDDASAASISVLETAAMLHVSIIDDKEHKKTRSPIIIFTPNCTHRYDDTASPPVIIKA
jgi:hypothetical protein